MCTVCQVHNAQPTAGNQYLDRLSRALANGGSTSAKGTPLNICSVVRQAKNIASVMLSTNTIADACMLRMLWWWEQQGH